MEGTFIIPRSHENKSINRRRLYFQQLELQVQKQSGINKIEKIKDFLVNMEYLNNEDKLSLKNMKSILEKLQVEGYYTGGMKVGNKEKYLELFENEIMNINFTEYQINL